MNHTLILFTGFTGLPGEEVICLIAKSYVLRTERWEDRTVQKYAPQRGVSARGRAQRNIVNRFN